MFFRDVDNQFLDEVQSRNSFSNSFVVFVSGVMKGYIFTVIIINMGCGNNRSAKISADIFNSDIRSAEIWLCTNIKRMSVFGVHFIFNFTKRWTNAGSFYKLVTGVHLVTTISDMRNKLRIGNENPLDKSVVRIYCII